MKKNLKHATKKKDEKNFFIMKNYNIVYLYQNLIYINNACVFKVQIYFCSSL